MKQALRTILNLLSYLFANELGQKILQKTLTLNTYLMGVGSGSGVNESGEKVIFKKLLQIKKNDLIVFDVGANQGQFLNMAFNNLKERSVELHSFEPSKYTFDVLKSNKPKGANVLLNNFGLGKEENTLTLHYDDFASGLASLTKRELEFKGISFEKTEQVQIKKLDEYCNKTNISEIDLLKIDVEGHEMDVLLGSRSFLEEKKIKLISFEFGGCNIDTRTYFKDFYYFLSDLGYTTYRITPTGYCQKIDKYEELLEQFRTTNYLTVLENKG